jgi:hypothetical protein
MRELHVRFEDAGALNYCVIVPFDAMIVNAYRGSSPLPGVVVFWTNRTSLANTLLVTAHVELSSHEF